MKSGELRVAIIGSGSISGYHVAGIRAAGRARVVAMVGRNREKTEQRARELGIDRAETDFRGVLEDASVDAVVVATPDNTHKTIAIAALEAGKPVLVQKPMALSIEECRAILDARDRTGCPLTVSFMHRYFPEVRWLKDLLGKGALGTIQTIRIRNATPGADWGDWFYTPEAVSGGVVMQLGVHGIDLCQHLFGPIESVSACVSRAVPERILKDGRKVKTQLEDNALAIYSFCSRAMASHEMSYTEIAGCDRFRLEVQADAGTVWLRTERGPAVIFAPAITGETAWVAPGLPRKEAFGEAHHRHWISIARGEAEPDDTAEAGLSSIQIAEAIYRSAREGRTIAVAPEYGLS